MENESLSSERAPVPERRSKYRSINRVVVNLGVKGRHYKNGDPDSLKVEHFSLAPNLALNLVPDQRWELAAW